MDSSPEVALNLSICSPWYWLLLAQTLLVWTDVSPEPQTPRSQHLCIANNWAFFSLRVPDDEIHISSKSVTIAEVLECYLLSVFCPLVYPKLLILKIYLLFRSFCALVWSVLSHSFSLFSFFSPAPLKFLQHLSHLFYSLWFVQYDNL